MKKVKKWVCQTDRTHIFNEPTADGYCDKCPYLEGILVLEDVEKQPIKKNGDNGKTIPVSPKPEAPEVGLCVILMDASSSMTDPAFKGSPLTRMSLVANSAASGIFDLERMQNNSSA